MRARAIIAVTALTVIQGGGAAAQGSVQDQAVACLSTMGAQTTWDQCRGALFEPCAQDAVGSAPHLACLQVQKTDWRGHLDAKTEVLNARLTPEGSGQLSELLGQWFGFVGNKCSAVAQAKADISADAAMLGCEISEFAGLATEFDSCLQGDSTSPYCTLKE
ncbi:hypothetical protein [Roseobacter sp. N2S]|uniref:hypothetical protein n=1 Tax=Roseobacter sp. N2S TaxID=2663844 RepID=UPI0028643CE5|nr:hypothetical protein [Roseobacter sp. N2S]MDR6264424.1 hypothetical protein [Roseobacter sp. N2S]